MATFSTAFIRFYQHVIKHMLMQAITDTLRLQRSSNPGQTPCGHCTMGEDSCMYIGYSLSRAIGKQDPDLQEAH